jgi:hypothetical protein
MNKNNNRTDNFDVKNDYNNIARTIKAIGEYNATIARLN